MHWANVPNVTGKGNSVPNQTLLRPVLSFMRIIYAEINWCSTASHVWSCWVCAQAAPGGFPSGLVAFPKLRKHTGVRVMHKVNSPNSDELPQELTHTDLNVQPNGLAHHEGKRLPFLPVRKSNSKGLLHLKSAHSQCWTTQVPWSCHKLSKLSRVDFNLRIFKKSTRCLIFGLSFCLCLYC